MMEPDSANANGPASKTLAPGITIFGVGSAGIAILESILAADLAGISAVAVHTEASALLASSAPEKVLLEAPHLRGLGTGGDPELGRKIAETHASRLKDLAARSQNVFILAGLGGGAGTGVAPVVARMAREAGAVVLGFVTTPFTCEGRRRLSQAEEGLETLRPQVDGLLVLDNQKICRLINDKTTVLETCRVAASLVGKAVQGAARLFYGKGLIEVRPAELIGILGRDTGEQFFAAADAEGENRAGVALEALLAHPLLDGEALGKAESILVSIVAGPGLGMGEINKICEAIHEAAPGAECVMGASEDSGMGERLSITLVAATHAVGAAAPSRDTGRGIQQRAGKDSESLNSQLLGRESGPRPASRCVPPPETLSRDKLHQMTSTHSTGGKRKLTRPKQTQLQLEIVSKGRFDKSEPTIHRGEDLDIPTYLRRGVNLN
jgi:cell division protein FtsZ